MGKRMTKALLRLCDLEKHVLEQVIAGLRQDVNAHYRAENELRSTAKEIEETNRQLQSMLAGELKTIASLREEVAKARFERDQARVELKALAEEKNKVRDWVLYIRDWHSTGQRGLLLGRFLDGSIALMERIGSQWCIHGIGSSPKPCGPPVYIYEFPHAPFNQQPDTRESGGSDG